MSSGLRENEPVEGKSKVRHKSIGKDSDRKGLVEDEGCFTTVLSDRRRKVSSVHNSYSSV